MTDFREIKLLQQVAERDAELVKRGELLLEKETQLKQARQEIKLLQEKINAMCLRLFGKKSDQLDPRQQQWLFQEFEAPGPLEGKGSGPQSIEAESARPPKRSPHPRKQSDRLPEHLPVVEDVLIPEEVTANPALWRKIGEEISERLDYQPARFLRLRTVRQKYVSRQDAELPPVIAPLPASLLERSIVTPGLLSQIVVSKFCDHLPLYRQESIYWTRHQVWISRQLMALWVKLAADWLRLIYEHIRDEVFAGRYVQVDETPIRYLAPGHGQTKKGYLWTCHRPGGDTVFYWRTSRGAACIDEIVPESFSGHIQCDGYTAYDAFTRQRGEAIELAGCWAHVRRKFVEAAKVGSKEAALIVHMIKNLYRCEAELRERRSGPVLRVLARSLQAKPVVERIHRTLKHWQDKHRFLPQSLMGKAIAYAFSEWKSLLIYLDEGELEIDNNLVENAIRPTAVGKKNWLFFGEAHAGERAAMIYTIIESCRRRGLDPYAYLRDTFTRLPNATNKQINELTPAAWAQEHVTAHLRAAA